MKQAEEKKHISSVLFLKLIPWIFIGAPVILTAGLPFFWDTLQLASRHAHFFFENNFTSFFLPNDMDSGHIPAFGITLALIWKIFGKTLWVSHMAMVPFVGGAIFFTQKLVDRIFHTRINWLITCFLLADATVLAQFTLVSPDIWIICFFTMALFAFWVNKRLLLAVAAIGLTLTSMRGMMIVASFFLAGLLLSVCRVPENNLYRGVFRRLKIHFFQAIPVYLPALFIAATYLVLHYLKRGWIGYHPAMPWFEHFGRVDLTGFFRNILILGWRLADHGRVFIWLTGFMLAVCYLKRRYKPDTTGTWLFTQSAVLLAVLSYSSLTFKNLLGHRYLIPVFFMVALTVIYYLNQWIKNKKTVTGVILLLFCGLLSGNFWVYPDHIAKGWDASLAYLPYQHLRHEMIDFIDENQIRFEETGTCFPNNIALKYIDLTDDKRSFGSIGSNLQNFRYIFYSNVFNDFPDAGREILKKEWKVVKELRRGQVKVILYQNPLLSHP